jgi:hypothetical protein
MKIRRWCTRGKAEKKADKFDGKFIILNTPPALLRGASLLA